MTTETTMLTLRETVLIEIRNHLDNIGTAYLRVGSLLNEARADFESQKEFLAWVETEFSIKKAQCYNLMNVAKHFDGDDAFKGVAMRVMLALIPCTDDAELMLKAAELAQAGKLDTAAVNELTGKPQKAATVNPVVQGIEQAKAAQQAADTAPQALQTVPEESTESPDADDAPFDDTPHVTLKTPVKDLAPVAPAKLDNAANAENERVTSLLETIRTLNQTIADMQATLNARTSERETRKAAAPMLPQFKSKCMYARLGLSLEEAEKKTAINKAKRELIKLGYGDGHDAYPLIMEAVEALTK